MTSSVGETSPDSSPSSVAAYCQFERLLICAPKPGAKEGNLTGHRNCQPADFQTGLNCFMCTRMLWNNCILCIFMWFHSLVLCLAADSVNILTQLSRYIGSHIRNQPRIFLIIIIIIKYCIGLMRTVGLLLCVCDPDSVAEGAGNAQESCLPLPKWNRRRRSRCICLCKVSMSRCDVYVRYGGGDVCCPLLITCFY